MRKRWFLVGMVILLVPGLLGGCGVAQEQHDAVVAERNAAQAEAASLQSDLDTAQAGVSSLTSDLDAAQVEAESLASDLDTAQAEVASLTSELSAAQSTVKTQEETIAKAKTFAEVISIVFVPALAGESVNEVELLFQWRDTVQDTGDVVLQRLFDAVMDSEAGDQELTDFFLYIFETLPKMLE